MSKEADSLLHRFNMSKIKIPQVLVIRDGYKTQKPQLEKSLKNLKIGFVLISVIFLYGLCSLLLLERDSSGLLIGSMFVSWVVGVFGFMYCWDAMKDNKKLLTACNEAESMVTDSVTSLLFNSLQDHNNTLHIFSHAIKLKDSIASVEENQRFFELMNGLAAVMDANGKVLTQKVEAYNSLSDTPKDTFEKFNKVIISDLLLTNELRDKFADDLQAISLNLEAELAAPELQEILASRKQLDVGRLPATT